MMNGIGTIFTFVKSYGFIADNDGRAVRKDGIVFVDGAIQTREYIRKRMCPALWAEYEYRETATEIDHVRGSRNAASFFLAFIP